MRGESDDHSQFDQTDILTIVQRSSRAATKTRSVATVARVIRELEALNRSTERDFLAVGEKLMEFRSIARQISSDMTAITELISGEQGRNASQALTRMLKHSKEIDARIERSGQAFGSVREHAKRLRQDFSGLSNMVAAFRSLCTLTRIETSRLGGGGNDLGHLAAEVRPLSESIQSTGEGVLEVSKALDQQVQAVIRSGFQLRDTQLKEMPALISGVIESLQSLEDRRQLALESSDRQAAQYAAVCSAIDGLVGCLQFHDITRQQVEHVIGALRQVSSHWMSHRRDSSALDGGTILRLQCSQLAEAASTFASSIDEIERDLKSIAERLESASEGVRALVGLSGNHQDSFFKKMEIQFSAILKVLSICASMQVKMGSTAAGLDKIIGRMRESVSEIRGTEIQIQRISTNATIRATHLGDSGAALNKIAEVMQRLALESNTNTEAAAVTLEAMSCAAGLVSQSGEKQADTDSATSEVSEEMRRALGELHSSSESSFGRVVHIAELGARLSQDIAAVRGGVTAGRMFADVVAHVQSELEGIGAQAVEDFEDRIAAKQQLEHFAMTYTMQSQRDVHESVVMGTSTPVTVAPTVQKATADEDLGDNVDLF